MKLYNSLTKKVEEFDPTGDEISVYSCGPTVYKPQTIGNISSFIYSDTLRRVLAQSSKKKVHQVINFTDVDDKTIKESLLKYPDIKPNESLLKLTRIVEEQFLKDLTSVGVDLQAIQFVKATEHIKSMQTLIKKLVKSKIAYITDDGVYFSIEKYKAKGKKYGQLVEVTAESTGAARVDNDEYDKDQIHDFVLWKVKKVGEPSWNFKINGIKLDGRPGWHIECSAMSVEYLGQPFDIHTGGVDLKFPHHENEIAQSTAVSDSATFARFFFHNEHLLIDGERMGKSKNNFYTIKDLTDKGYDPLAFRMFVLQGHYQKQINFSWQALDGAASRLNNIRNYVEASMQIESKPISISEDIKELEDNLHTPKFLEKLDFDVDNPGIPIKKIDQLLGLSLSEIKDAPDEVKKLIVKRQTARSSDDFESADKIRSQLDKLGFKVKDSANGPIWQRIY